MRVRSISRSRPDSSIYILFEDEGQIIKKLFLVSDTIKDKSRDQVRMEWHSQAVRTIREAYMDLAVSRGEDPLSVIPFEEPEGSMKISNFIENEINDSRLYQQ